MSIDLRVLAKMLESTAIPSQMAIAKAIGCDQPFISRARAGKIRRVTPRVEKLWRYVETRIATMQSSSFAAPEKASVSSRSPRRSPASRKERDRSTEALKAAATSFQQYLDDGFDPRLIVDQINVLRRAQLRR